MEVDLLVALPPGFYSILDQVVLVILQRSISTATECLSWRWTLFRDTKSRDLESSRRRFESWLCLIGWVTLGQLFNLSN